MRFRHRTRDGRLTLPVMRPRAASDCSLRVFSVVDTFTGEWLAFKTDTSLPSRRVTRVLQRIVEQRGTPQFVRSGHGPEVCSRHYLAVYGSRNRQHSYSTRKPTQSRHIESFRGCLRDERLNASWVWNLWDARRHTTRWRIEYNRHSGPTLLWRIKTRRVRALVGTNRITFREWKYYVRRNRIKAKPFGRPRRP
jgi:putative transposase